MASSHSHLKDFPGVLFSSANRNLVEAAREKQQLINEMLSQSGAVLFRNFNVNSASDFERVVEAFEYETHDFSGGAWLVGDGPRVSVFNLSSSVPLNYHNEGAYLKNPPSKLMLYCDVEPAFGEGATTLVDSHALYKKMLELFPEFVRELEEKQLIYGRKMDEHTWKTMFGADDKTEVEKRAEGMDSSIEWMSQNNDAIWYSKPRNGVIKDEARGGRKVWFNAISSMMDTFEILGSLAPTFGDGTPLPEEPLRACQTIMKQLEVQVSWKKGDVLLIDNVAAMHAKQACISDRRIFISLAA